MKPILVIGLTVLVAAVSIHGVPASKHQDVADAPSTIPSVVNTEQVKLVYAQPYVLDQAYTHYWRAEQPAVAAGYLVVVRTDQSMLLARQVHNPLLFVGAQTVERINVGYESGHMVALVPAPLTDEGEVDLDLSATPVFFGKPNVLPESLGAADIENELARALQAGVTAQPPDVVQAALDAGGGTIYLPHKHDLLVWAADVIELYSPLETDLVAGLRVPLVR